MAALREVGLEKGDAVFVHSSFAAFEGFRGKATEILSSIERVIGPEGTLLMPSIPFTGTALAYVAAGKVTDIRRTPSRMGLLTELLRRQKGTVRSVHPTHPVLARGGSAEALTAGHAETQTPCGKGSPFAKLRAADGKLLFLGAAIESMTFFHYLEEIYEARLPISPFAAETVTATVRDGEISKTVSMRLFDPDQSRKRRIDRLWPRLKDRDGSRTAKVGSLDLLLLETGDVESVFAEMVAQGEALYDD